MGTKFDEFEESTKVKSAAEIDEMLRQASVTREPREEVDEFECHTQIGHVAELVARTAIPDDEPPVAPTSSNVIRRSAPIAAVRPSAVIRAVGSANDVPVAVTEEDVAFEPWDEAPVHRPSTPIPLPLAAPEPSAQVKVAAPAPIAHARSGVRWGVVAWVVLLLAMMGAGTMGYMKIAELEQELAMTKSALDAERVR